MNQYERGKHTPDYGTVCRLAAVLDVPVAFFYAEDDAEAELLLLFSAMPRAFKRQLLAALRKTTEGNGSPQA